MPTNGNSKWNPAGESPVGPKRSQRARSESCVVAERSVLRSVDSETIGLSIEPRNNGNAGPTVCHQPEGSIAPDRDGEVGSGPPGSERARHVVTDSPGTWEIPSVRRTSRLGSRRPKPRPSRADSVRERSEQGAQDGTGRTSANESVGRQTGKSERRIVPVKRGNRPEGPRGGKGAPAQTRRWRERHWRHRALK